MIGRYYDSWGTKQSILHRYGDNRGDPFFGPVQLTYQSNLRFFVLQKNQVISLQNTFGGIECHICSLEDQEKLEDAILDAEIQAELTNIYSSSSKKDNHTAPPNKLYTVYLDINPIYISCIFNTNSLFILDSRNLIKVYDIEQRTIQRTFGKTGLEVGEFNNVTCIHAFRIGSQSFVLVGDSGANQRVNLFTADGEFLCSIGSKGPMIGQFRDITSISTCIPSDLQDPNTDFYCKEYIPSWYKGGNSNYTEDELQDFLVADDQMNNFVIGKDKKSKEENAHIVHYVNRDKTMSKLPIKYGEVIMRVKLPTTTTTNNNTTTTNPSKTPPKPTTRSSVTSFPTSTTKSFMKPPATKTTTESENNNNNLKKKESLVLKQSIEETIIRKTGFHLIEPERFDDGGEPLQVYNSLYELIKHRKDYFLLQEEKRDSFLTAVCDRKNFRIQILRGFWTKSLIYSPFFIPIDVIGGSKNRYCSLQDPIDVCYSNTGKELIISDNGKNQMLLLSSTVLEVIKVIQPVYLSSRDLQLDTDNDNSNNDQQQQPGEQLVNSKIKNIEQSISIVDEINKQFIASIDIPDVPLEKKDNENGNNTARTRASFSSNKGVGKKKDSKFSDLEIENMKKPCSISFNQHGNMLVGFKSGGIYVYQKNRNSPMGMLEKLQIKSMEKIILEYLTYQDIEILRNTCVYLHNFTRELRLTYRIFPSYRQKQYNKLIYLFFNYSRVGKEGLPQLSNIELKDKYNCKICPYYLQLLCPLNELTCNYSHNIIYIHRKEINETNAYICYNELIYFISQIFHPKFIWQNEIYIKELFHAFSYEENIVIRQGALNRPGDPFREKVPQTTRVINFLSYLEIMVLLEEHMNKYKSLSAHKLFCPTAVKRFIPKVPTSIESVENVVPYSNPLIQYDKGGINIPPNRHLQGKRIISKKGYENVERKEDDKRKEHVAVFQYHTERVAALIDQLFT